MADSAVEVAAGGVRIYKVTTGLTIGGSSIGLLFLPPGEAVLREVVGSHHVFFFVFTGKISVEIGCDGGGGGRKKVFGASPGTFVLLEPGNTFSLKNTSKTTTQILYARFKDNKNSAHGGEA
jgi:mannose-6-phosphate isomerase-like protein (cupin superfamily)